MIKQAYNITLKNLLNCYYRESSNYSLKHISSNTFQLHVGLNNQGTFLEVLVNISPVLKSPIWTLPCYSNNNGEKEQLTSLHAITILIKELIKSENNSFGYKEVLERVINSANNLSTILEIRKSNLITAFSNKSSFIANEQNLIVGHRQQPDPKSREGFTRDDFIKYSPETNGGLQLHYFYASKDILVSENLLEEPLDKLLNSLLKDSSFPERPNEHYELFVLHPWQANYLDGLKEIKEYKLGNKIIDIGVIGPWFYPTTSVRTVYSPEANIMLKFSLNIAITNSVRVNLARECKRSMSVYKLYKDKLGSAIKSKFPHFSLMVDPAYIALKADNEIINSSICIFRDAKFDSAEDIACIASLTEPNPFNDKTRINSLIEYVGREYNLSLYESAKRWFGSYLSVAISPILWLYSEFDIAIEAHQQNLLVKLENGLPVESFYRDSQGYYYIENHSNQEIFGDLSDLCIGSEEFIDHHFCYYFIVNQLISVIEAIANTGYINEQSLVKTFVMFLESFSAQNKTSHRFCKKLLTSDKLPLKANLLTRLQGLDELQAPITSQSIYVNINNPFKENYESI